MPCERSASTTRAASSWATSWASSTTSPAWPTASASPWTTALPRRPRAARSCAGRTARVANMADSMLRGVYVPIVTPFGDDGSVSVEALERLALRLLDDGVAGLVPLGTTGEAPLLDEDERRIVIAACARACESRGAHLVVGAGSNSTRQTVAAVKGMADTPGLTAVLCLVPYYLRPTQEGIVAHFDAVAAASPVPVVIYNIPIRTGCRADAETLLRLAEVENIVGVKQSTALDADAERLLADVPDDFAVL